MTDMFCIVKNSIIRSIKISTAGVVEPRRILHLRFLIGIYFFPRSVVQLLRVRIVRGGWHAGKRADGALWQCSRLDKDLCGRGYAGMQVFRERDGYFFL